MIKIAEQTAMILGMEMTLVRDERGRLATAPLMLRPAESGALDNSHLLLPVREAAI